jgi:hypothetical protein
MPGQHGAGREDVGLGDHLFAVVDSARSFGLIVPPTGERFASSLLAERSYRKPVRAFRIVIPREGSMNVNYGMEGAKYGISFGTALAIAISYTNNHSILWAIIHGFFSWLYVIYFALLK